MGAFRYLKMRLSWNEIRQRAIAFSHEWRGEKRERAEAQSFWNEFFNVFGIKRRTVASFEEPVKNLKGKFSFIDLWRLLRPRCTTDVAQPNRAYPASRLTERPLPTAHYL